MNALDRLRAGLSSSPWLAIWLLLPLLGILPPVPVDETRYLSIAWEMRQSAELIALHLNGFPYFDKPPLLFWLLNLSWSLFGASLWTSRAMVVLFGAGCIRLLTLIERRLAGVEAQQAGWLLLGCVYFLLFCGAVMFDIVLCFFVLLAFLAVIQWVQGGDWRALVLLFVASGLGMLTKGPVLLLHLAGPMLLARWWAPVASKPGWQRIGAMLAITLLSGLPVLFWALAEVRHLGASDAHELLVTQTAGRVLDSFAHNRAFWWYLMWLPLIVLPWPLVLRWKHVRGAASESLHSSAGRFGFCAVVPALIGFSFVSGKQLHYLLPLFPGAALLLGAMSRAEPSLLSPLRLLGLMVLIAGWLAWTILRPEGMHQNLSMPWGMIALALCMLGLAVLLLRQVRGGTEQRAALVSLLLTMALLPVMRIQLADGADVRELAQQVVALRQQGVPLARVGDEPGLLTFFARLPEPLPTAGDPRQWAQQHPQGFLLMWSAHTAPPPDLQGRVWVAKGWVGLRPATAWLPRAVSTR
ncbi:ArnT family glycosyltransferase [Dyella tabacisoli]|uniref:Glycosyltransferase RgtA/B/C/D-like domain-containing protein n=1 Tax=Dyella tabacisoli TaxID=2282381 RepID=A0A369UK66_9GAMM|nr:glycosyltransferase family 39 protein [Dyella tabacisoli]RDD81152.1 hypothetical protein DVJ77_12555 [Dyella tabacisoli]